MQLYAVDADVITKKIHVNTHKEQEVDTKGALRVIFDF